MSKKDNEKFSCSLNSLTKDGVELIEYLAAEENVEDNIILKEEIAEVRAAINKLSPKDKELLEWVYFKEKTIKEYASLKGLNRITVVKRKTRAIEKLRKYFFS